MKTKTLAALIVISAFFLLLLTIIGGCGDNSISSNNNGSGSDNVSLSIKADNGALNPLSIVITEAKALINEVEVEQEPSGIEQHIRINPFVVYFNLNLNGTLITVTSGNIPEGLYNKIKFKIHKPEDNEIPPDPEFKEGTSGNQRFSFIIKGSYNGNNFVYKSRKSVNLVINFPVSINFQQLQRNITLLINPSFWFRDGSVELDPRDPDNESTIDNNIKNSFRRAFRDDNKDGLPDDN